MNTAVLSKPGATGGANSTHPPSISWIFLVAVIVRVLVMFHFKTYEIPADRDHWSFAYEIGRIARSLVLGHGYSSPLPETSGPLGTCPPAYPFLLALVFRIFGVYSKASACGMYLIQTLFSGLSCLMLWRLG